MLHDEALAILDGWTMLLDGKRASTNRSIKPSPNRAGVTESYWRAHEGTTPDWRNTRSVAYLVAYLDMAGGAVPGEGIALGDGYLWPDRAVMRAYLAANCIALTSGAFQLTDKGEALVAPMLKFSNGRVRRGMRPEQ